MSQATVGSLFAAMGGFAHAFRSLGARVAWANEKDRFAVATFRHNLPEVRIIEKPAERLSVYKDHLDPVDVLTAGFPCQPFSVAGRKEGLRDGRGVLFLEILRLVREFGPHRPKLLFLENVKHLRTHDRGRTFLRIQNEIQKAGYWFSPANVKVLNTLDYSNIPQNRERLFMVALSVEYFSAGAFHFPEPSHPRRLLPVTAFLDISARAADYFYFEPGGKYHVLFDNAIREGGDGIYQLRRSYVRKNMSNACFTLVACMGGGGHNQPVIRDPWGIRKLTPDECARLQGYEASWFSFPESVSLTQRYKQVGNSVTVPVLKKIARTILDLLADQASREVAYGEPA